MISVINMLLVDRYKQCIFCPVIPIGHLPWRGNALSQPLLPMNIGRLRRVLDRQRRMGSGVRRLTVICDCLHRTHCCSTDHASIQTQPPPPTNQPKKNVIFFKISWLSFCYLCSRSSLITTKAKGFFFVLSFSLFQF